jgi:hypothetical protein
MNTSDLLSGALIGCLLLAMAQPILAQDDLQYQHRANRYEGIKPKPVSGYDVELLSARIDHKEETSTLGEKLSVKFYLKEPTEVYLFVRELEYKHYYWLDKVEPREPWRAGFGNVFQWPTKDVLGQLQDFKPSELGVIARLGKPVPSVMETVAPVVFYQSKPPSKAKGYLFTFRLREDGKVTATVFKEGGDEALARQTFSHQAGGRPFTVKWDLSNTDVAEGYYRLVLKGYFLDTNESISQTVSFYHRPNITAQ